MDKQNATDNQWLAVPIIAILLEASPFILTQISYFASLSLLALLILPIVGFILGVVALCKGKGKLGIAGRIIAIIAVVLPALWIGAITIFFVGASTGMISLM